MANSFQLNAQPVPRGLRISLSGPFDCSSAFELLHFLAENCSFDDLVNIDTTGLVWIHPLGPTILSHNLPQLQSRMNVRVRFEGGHKDEMR